MIFPKLSRENFHYEFFENRKISAFYNKAPEILRPFVQMEKSLKPTQKNGFTVINCIPPYLGLDLSHISDEYAGFREDYRLGFAMDLSVAPSAGEFLRKQLGKKVFRNLRQDRQRLEREFDITLQIYHQEIDRATCEKLMDLLEGFIRQRFSQRTSKHAALNRWQHYKTSVFKEVNAGNAAFFVLRDKQKPIAISVSYLFKEIMFAALASFDQNFYRYSLGRQMFYHQIEWCYEKGFQLLDLGWGAFDYKIKFSNAVYTYQTHAIYPKGNIMAKAMAFSALQFVKLKYYLVMLRDRQFSSPEKTYEGRWLSYGLIKG